MTKLQEDEGGGGGPTNVVGTGMVAGLDGTHPKSVFRKRLRREKPKVLGESVTSMLPQILDGIDTTIRTLQMIDVQALIHHLSHSVPKDGNTAAQIAGELSPKQIKRRKEQLGEVTKKLITAVPLMTNSIETLEMARKVMQARNKISQPRDREMSNRPPKKKKKRKGASRKRRALVKERFEAYISILRKGV